MITANNAGIAATECTPTCTACRGAFSCAFLGRRDDFTGTTDSIDTAARVSPLAGTDTQSRGAARADGHYRSGTPVFAGRTGRGPQATHARGSGGRGAGWPDRRGGEGVRSQPERRVLPARPRRAALRAADERSPHNAAAHAGVNRTGPAGAQCACCHLRTGVDAAGHSSPGTLSHALRTEADAGTPLQSWLRAGRGSGRTGAVQPSRRHHRPLPAHAAAPGAYRVLR